MLFENTVKLEKAILKLTTLLRNAFFVIKNSSKIENKNQTSVMTSIKRRSPYQ